MTKKKTSERDKKAVIESLADVLITLPKKGFDAYKSLQECHNKAIEIAEKYREGKEA